MTSDRKKTGMPFWATVVVVAVLAYLASTGPLVWLDAHKLLPRWMNGPVDVFYAPLEILGSGSRTVHWAIAEYWKLWGHDGGVKNEIPH